MVAFGNVAETWLQQIPESFGISGEGFQETETQNLLGHWPGRSDDLSGVGTMCISIRHFPQDFIHLPIGRGQPYTLFSVDRHLNGPYHPHAPAAKPAHITIARPRHIVA